MIVKRSFLDYDVVKVISGGKTGSSTLALSVFETLRQIGHSTNPFPTSLSDCHSHLYQDFIRITTEATVKKRALIITSFREPISRMISSFFQNIFTRHLSHIHLEYPYQQAIQEIRQWLNKALEDKTYIEAWHPVDRPPCFVSNFYFHTTPTYDILYLRFDQVKEWKSQIQHLFPDFMFSSTNEASQKLYYPLYKEISKTYKHPKFQDLVSHERSHWSLYYTEDEMNTILQLWI